MGFQARLRVKASHLKQNAFIDRVPSFSDPTMLGSGVLKRWRENYYGSAVLAAVAKPVDLACRELSSRIEKKVKKNGAAISLPNGRTMRIGRDAGVSIASLLYWNGLDSYEAQTSRTLRFFFERATMFVDVGANYGFYSVLAALWNPQLRVTSLEPVPQIYKGLTRNLVLNDLQERVSAYQLALADRTGSATFYLPGTDGKDCETTGTLVTDSWQSRKHSPEIEVETVLFDDFERSHPMKVDLVKIDVEDFEAAVLAGMARTIRRDRPLIICDFFAASTSEREDQADRRISRLYPVLDYFLGLYPSFSFRL